VVLGSEGTELGRKAADKLIVRLTELLFGGLSLVVAFGVLHCGPWLVRGPIVLVGWFLDEISLLGAEILARLVVRLCVGKGVFAGIGVFPGRFAWPIGVIVGVERVLAVFIKGGRVVVLLCIEFIAGRVVSQEVVDLFLFFHQEIVELFNLFVGHFELNLDTVFGEPVLLMFAFLYYQSFIPELDVGDFVFELLNFLP
jgi:hypothetical protein